MYNVSRIKNLIQPLSNQDIDWIFGTIKAKRREETYLKRFVEEETEIGENDPQLLPAVAVFELAQQVTAQLVLFTK